jgi:hypothetical protein
MENLLDNENIDKLAETLAREFENRNEFPLTSFPQYISRISRDKFYKKCNELHVIVERLISEKAFFDKILTSAHSSWVRSALWFGSENGKYNLSTVALHFCMSLIQQKFRGIDDYVEHMQDNSICKDLSISVDKNLLINLADKRFVLKNHGILFENNILIYPHQFLRRFYSSNFVGMPALLRKAQDLNAHAYIRLDPFRRTTANYYKEIMEFDYWYGPRFSRELLINKHNSERTLHTSSGYFSFIYDVKHTVFRTKMMDLSIREFTIEEYCPINTPYGELSPGIGQKFCIQKFAHFCYDQDKKYFSHLDGAVRVFEVKKYKENFNLIASGLDVDEKVGVRHKMFLVEGQLDEDFTKELLTEWFRYNPHIMEYFSNKTIDPVMTFQEFEKIHFQHGG